MFVFSWFEHQRRKIVAKNREQTIPSGLAGTVRETGNRFVLAQPSATWQDEITEHVHRRFAYKFWFAV